MVLRIDRHDSRGGCRLIEVALCNDRETPRRIPGSAWLYQTKLSVSADGMAVFLPVTDALEDTRSERDDELRRLKLQYRDRLEFAIGRTCSVDWTVAKDARRASEVYTTWLPTCQTPQTTAEEIRPEALRRGSGPADEGQRGRRPGSPCCRSSVARGAAARSARGTSARMARNTGSTSTAETTWPGARSPKAEWLLRGCPC
ncbi:MAG: hypothetical protein ACRDS9_09685 [Pseudonocardiaceae bacterium]